MQTAQTPATTAPGSQFCKPLTCRPKIPYAGKESPEETRALKASTDKVSIKAASKENAITKAAKPTMATKQSSKGKTKLAIVAALLLRKSGTTNAEILEVTGWPSVSVPGQAKAAGLTLRKEKVPGKPTRYFGSK